VIRIFPNDASAIGLVGALLAEINESWQERLSLHLYLDEYRDWITARKSREPGTDQTRVA